MSVVAVLNGVQQQQKTRSRETPETLFCYCETVLLFLLFLQFEVEIGLLSVGFIPCAAAAGGAVEVQLHCRVRDQQVFCFHLQHGESGLDISFHNIVPFCMVCLFYYILLSVHYIDTL